MNAANESLTDVLSTMRAASPQCAGFAERIEAANSPRDFVADLILTDPVSGEACSIVSSLREEQDGQSFDVQSAPDAPKWRIDVRITEC
jgi:hypothetical protein